MKKNKALFLLVLLPFTLQLIVPIACVAQVEQINKNVTVNKINDDRYSLEMDENNHDYNGPTQLVRISNVESVTFDQFVGTISFRYIIEAEDGKSNSFILYANQSFDYETQERKYLLSLNIDGAFIIFILDINNIDDESPSMNCPRCSFNENTVYNKDNSTCSCTVSDPDGWLNKMTFKVIDGIHEESKLFNLEYKEVPSDDIKTSMVNIYPVSTLDYENISFYIFYIQAKDSASHPTIPDENTAAIVAVNDMRDSEPSWNRLIVFEQFEEQQEQNFQVSARDGDVGLNKEVCYGKVREDDEEANYINIQEKTGAINVAKIDRDKNDIMIYASEIQAYICDEPEWNITQNMSFYIIDIDNNPPLVNWVFDYKKHNNTFDGKTDKSTSLEFFENYAGSLNTTIFIRDIDTGENAQFTVEIEDLEKSAVSYKEAFMVVPTAGYRSGDFQLNVRNATYLDYEDSNWQKISFVVSSRGSKNPTHEDRLYVHINLKDYNDEIPKFETSEYSVTINETTKKDVTIIQVLATDRDKEDTVLRHELIGSGYALGVLEIESGTGSIKVKKDNAFDFDTVNPIFVQVRATDKVGHSATVPLTVNLLDVNNKAPTIDGGEPISVEENQKSKTKLISSITASDVDSTADLTVRIDWSSSYAIKNSRRLNMANETIAREVQFLDVTSEGISNSNRQISIELDVNDRPAKPAPDYELFDSLYLNLIVTDLNTDEEFLKNKETSAVIVISIIDINDNTPYFVEKEGENRTVQENAVINTSPGSLIAIDLDVTDIVTFNCKADKEDADWLEINPDNGLFTVKNENINADIPTTYYFNYTCTASDGIHTSEPLQISFYIIDRNNRIPQIDIDSTVHLLEQPEDNAIVIDMRKQITDQDRDEPFHTVICQFSTDQCNDKFSISNNIIKVRRGTEIDRDTKERNFTCSITCMDNPTGWRGEPSLFSSTSLTIIVDDRNNFIPELATQDFECYENLKKHEKVHEVIGKDLDAGLNGTIDFNIISVINVETKKDIQSLFSILHDDSDYNFNESHKLVHLIASEDLRGYYGVYNITFELSDEGTPKLSQEQWRTFTIKRFNFASPTFVFPKTDNQRVQLMSDQTINSPLHLYKSSEYLSDFKVTDDTNKEDCSKWIMKFNITQLEPENEVTIFKLLNNQPCSSQLQINNEFDSDRVINITYQLGIFAWIDEESTGKTDEAPYYSNTSITIRFYDNYQQPTFDYRNWTIQFVEGDSSQSVPLLKSATYEDDDDMKIFYFIVPGQNETIEKIFDVNVDSGMVSIKEIFYYDFDQEFNFQIVASNDSNKFSSNPDSYLNVTVEVQPANLRPPSFIRDYFFAAIMPGFPRSTIVATAEAIDPDVIDANKLKYSINSDIQWKGIGLDDLSKTNSFLVDSSNGNITLNFRVETTMSGYFYFEVCVRDQEDEYHNGPHEVCTKVYIFIITDDKTVDFRFYNNITDVQTKEIEMLKIVSEIVGIQAYRQTIEAVSSSEGEETRARLYFINRTITEDQFFNVQLLQDDPVTAVDSNTILRIVSNVNTFSKLVTEMREKTQLILKSFPSTNTNSENLEATLKAWLIGVSVVLGALCFALLLTFILKIKRLNRRIEKLTEKRFGSQDSGLNRLGISAPTTNKHTIEGSNPVFNNNEIKKSNDVGDFDVRSTTSGDSDLIGVEENPEFDYNFDKQDNKDISTYL